MQSVYSTAQANCAKLRDSGYMIRRNYNSLKTSTYKRNYLKIQRKKIKFDIKTNIKEVDFLDVTFSFNKSIYQPLGKQNDIPFCTHTSSIIIKPILIYQP